MRVGVFGKVLDMRNDVIFAVETTLMIIMIILELCILVYLAWNNNRKTVLSVDDLDKIEKRKCP